MGTQADTGLLGTAFKDGAKICDLEEWSYKEIQALIPVMTNCTNGTEEQLNGKKTWEGTIKVLVSNTADNKVPFASGTSYTLKLQTDEAGVNYWTGPAKIGETALTVSRKADGALEITYPWKSNGVWTGAGNCVAGATVCCGSGA